MGYKPKIVIVHSTGTEIQHATNSGDLQKYAGPSYADAHDAATAGYAYNNNSFTILNQDFGSGSGRWQILRGGVEFPVSTGLTVVSASIHLWGASANAAEGAFNCHLVSGSALAGTLVVADYGDLLSATTSFGSIASSAFVEEGWNEFVSNSAGITALQNAIASGVFRVGVRHSKDIDNVSPTGPDSTMTFYGSNSPSSAKPRFHFQIIGY